MIHAKIFVEKAGVGRHGDGQFNLETNEEGNDETLAGIEGGDRPLFVQVATVMFCPRMLLMSSFVPTTRKYY